jgi:hypothetical protein
LQNKLARARGKLAELQPGIKSKGALCDLIWPRSAHATQRVRSLSTTTY